MNKFIENIKEKKDMIGGNDMDKFIESIKEKEVYVYGGGYERQNSCIIFVCN